MVSGGGWGTGKPTHHSSRLKTGAPLQRKGATERVFGSFFLVHSFEFQKSKVQGSVEGGRIVETFTPAAVC